MLQANPNCCEECALGVSTYIPCNKPAAYIVGWKGRSDPPIRMCEACADHNVKNRGGEIKETIKKESTADDLIARHIQLDDWVTAQSKKFEEFLKPHKTEMADIKNKLLEMINRLGGEKIGTASGTAYTSVITTPKVADREKYLGFLWALSDAEWTDFGDAMLQVSAPQKDTTVEYMQSHGGQLPPGVTTSSFTRLNIRRT